MPAAPIWNIAQALESPQAVARELLRDAEDARLPGLRLPTQPVRFNGAAPNLSARAPALGEHTDEVLGSPLAPRPCPLTGGAKEQLQGEPA